MKRKLPTLLLTLALTPAAMMGQKSGKPDGIAPAPLPVPTPPKMSPLPQIPSVPAPSGRIDSLAPTAGAAATIKPVDMKLLVLAGDGNESSYLAIRYFLDHIGIPYHAVVTATTPLPTLNDTAKGFYQGIILATGNLAFNNNGNYESGLSVAEWAALDAYMISHSVRAVSYYTWPEPRYGISFTSAFGTTDTDPGLTSILPAGQPAFSYMNAASQVKVQWAWVYGATPSPAAGEVTTPYLTMRGHTVGAYHKKVDGREYLAFTFDNSPYLLHSALLNYGIINWATKGVFLGSRRIYLSPQNDDLFLASDQFVHNDPNCRPAPGQDPTFDPSTTCPDVRMAATDLYKLRDWQVRLNGSELVNGFRVAHAFNGFGTTTASGAPVNDGLTQAAKALKSYFYWLSHTYDHENLDCFKPVPNSGICTPANYAQSVTEINENKKIAAALGLALDSTSMVTPGISGLNNANFLSAARDNGLRYFVGDLSRPEWQPTFPNTGTFHPNFPTLFIIPRRATNIFYNVHHASSLVAGSEPDEYNYLFGPAGIFRLPDGSPFFTVNQTYRQIIDRESDALLSYMLRYEIYPSMFHQANFVFYNGTNSLFTDLIDETIRKYTALVKLPVSSLPQATIGQRLIERMEYLAGGVKGTYTPGVGVTLTSQKGATVPVTGACAGACETYGGQRQSRIRVNAGQTVSILVP